MIVSSLLIFINHILAFPEWPTDLHGYRDFTKIPSDDDHIDAPRIPEALIPHGITRAKARKISSNGSYLLQVIHGVEVEDGSIFASIDSFRRFENPFVLRLVESFSTRQLGDADLVVVYENLPGAMKLECACQLLRSDQSTLYLQNWIGQLLWAMYSVHRAGLCFDKILCIDNILVAVSLQRVAILGVGIIDLLNVARKKPYSGSIEDRQVRKHFSRPSKACRVVIMSSFDKYLVLLAHLPAFDQT